MAPLTFRFGPFLLDMGAYQLQRDGAARSLPPKVLDLLALLATKPGQLFSKDDIFTALWPDTAVTDNAITQVVSAAREALEDDASAPTYIQTVPRRGYRFIANLISDGPATTQVSGTTPSVTGATRRIAVSDFVNLSSADAPAWLGAGIAETLTNDLRGVADLVLLDRNAVAPAVRQGDISAAANAGLDLLVVGSYQAFDTRLRVTGRVIDVRTATAIGQAKADGVLSDIFALQDAVVAELLSALHLVTPASSSAPGGRETPSLDAYEALTEGRLKLDSLDPSLAQAAVGDFTRAVTLDPAYALAWVGLAHAHFWLHQRTRLSTTTDVSHLDAAVAHAGRAIEIDPDLGEAHAALAFFLAQTTRGDEAVQAGRIAVRLEPNDWRHHFRLGMAAWGDERLACVHRVHQLYPDFTPVYFVGAMVHIARGELAEADRVLDDGIGVVESSSWARSLRFPANGLYWLRGLIRLTEGDVVGAHEAFDCEASLGQLGLYADEYARNVAEGHGFAALAAGDSQAAERWFRQALDLAPGHVRAQVGLGDTLKRIGRRADAQSILGQARSGIDELTAAGRTTDALMALAHWQVVADHPEEAIGTLDSVLRDSPPGMSGWTIPIEPWLAPLRGTHTLVGVLARLSARAR